MATTDWNPLLRTEFDKDYWKQLQRFVADERSRAEVFPPAGETFAALHLTPFAAVPATCEGLVRISPAAWEGRRGGP